MTSKERMHAALAHEEPDRVPLDVWMTPEIRDALVRQTGAADSWEMKVALGHDCLTTHVGQVAWFYREESRYVDPWGVTWQSVPCADGRGSYTEMVGHPLAGDDALLDSFRVPDPGDPAQYAEAAELLRRFGRTHSIVGGVSCSVFEGPWYLRGMEAFLEDLLVNKDYAHRLIDLVSGFYLEAGLRLVEMGCDILLAGDDVGTQDRMLISPELFREFLKPRYGRLFGEYKRANPALKIAAHICGFIEPVIDDLVEAGLDILNPVQPLAMDPARLKKRYGKRLSFWGAVDDQAVMPLGTPAEVDAEVRRRITELAPGGGYVVCPSHNLQPGTPMENIHAFYRAARRYGGYPLGAWAEGEP